MHREVVPFCFMTLASLPVKYPKRIDLRAGENGSLGLLSYSRGSQGIFRGGTVGR